jgi:hypothetical protein
MYVAGICEMLYCNFIQISTSKIGGDSLGLTVIAIGWAGRRLVSARFLQFYSISPAEMEISNEER